MREQKACKKCPPKIEILGGPKINCRRPTLLGHTGNLSRTLGVLLFDDATFVSLADVARAWNDHAAARGGEGGGEGEDATSATVTATAAATADALPRLAVEEHRRPQRSAASEETVWQALTLPL